MLAAPDGRTVTLDASTDRPLTILRNSHTGRVRALLDGVDSAVQAGVGGRDSATALGAVAITSRESQMLRRGVDRIERLTRDRIISIVVLSVSPEQKTFIGAATVTIILERSVVQTVPSTFASITTELDKLWEQCQSGEVQKAIDLLWAAGYAVNQSWSGSSLGYQANVYFRDFAQPPAGDHFSVEWGIDGGPFGSRREWVEYNPDDVARAIRERAGLDDIGLKDFNNKAVRILRTQQLATLSILAGIDNTGRSDGFLGHVKTKIEDITLPTPSELVQELMGSGELVTRDEKAAMQGIRIPYHFLVLATVVQTRRIIESTDAFRELVHQTATHTSQSDAGDGESSGSTGSVFIGHGQNQDWRELKDFLEERLKLRVEEFNRVPVAGRPTADRLAEMLDRAGFAFLLLTGEDEVASGEMHPRMNVVHELGLFQGRLGFGRAIVLLEDGCTEFSNIHGLGQIRFRKQQISSAFEEIRQVLEREKIV